ncbi:MAG: hypothetical protein NXI13_11520 [Proteobacteria bacterium]|nr:hypothetical protein [Pseudomonadota bacterium]
MRFLVLLPIVAGVLMLGWAGYDYNKSGEEVFRSSLDGTEGTLSLPPLDPSMNPLRALLQADYEIEISGGESTAFTYAMKLVGPGDEVLFDINQKHRDGAEDATPTFETKSIDQVLATFSVTEAEAYSLNWTMTPDKAKISQKFFSLRQNVRPLQTNYIIGGAFCVALSVMLLLRQRRRPS